MRLLVTRPEPDATRTAARLAVLGHDVLIAPMLAIDFQPAPAIATPGAVVVTSRNGIRALQRWPDAIDWRDLPLYVVGHATAGAAREAGFNDVRIGGNDAASLAELIVRSFRPSDGTLVYPAAVDRSGDLEVDLAARGYSLRVIEAYRAHAADALPDDAARQIRERTLEGLLFFSQRTATTFGTLVTAAGLLPALADATIYALSEQVAAPLRAMSRNTIQIAATPSEDALLDLIPAPSE